MRASALPGKQTNEGGIGRCSMPSRPGLKRVHVPLPVALHRRLRRVAELRGRSLNEVVREAIDATVEIYEEEERDGQHCVQWVAL